MTFIPSGSSSYRNDDRGGYRRGDDRRGFGGLLRQYFAPFVSAVAEHGLRGLLAIIVAAAIAFLPAGILIWFNHLRFSPVIQLRPGQVVIVKPERHEQLQRNDQVGGTSLLSVVCEVPASDGPVPLLTDDDPVRPTGFMHDSRFVRNEQIYLRPLVPTPLAENVVLPLENTAPRPRTRHLCGKTRSSRRKISLRCPSAYSVARR